MIVDSLKEHFESNNHLQEQRLIEHSNSEDREAIEAAIRGARKSFQEPGIKDLTREVFLGYSLLAMRAYNRMEKSRTPAISTFGRRMLEIPVQMQMAGDMNAVAEVDHKEDKAKEIIQEYGINPEGRIILEEPHLFRGLAKSTAIFLASQKTDHWLGYGLWGALFAAITFNNDLRQMVDSRYWELQAGATALTLMGTGVRYEINRRLLDRDGYSPDAFETVGSVVAKLVKDSVDPKQKRKINRISAMTGGGIHLAYQIYVNTAPLYVFGPYSGLAAWFSNVFDEAYFTSISYAQLKVGRKTDRVDNES